MLEFHVTVSYVCLQQSAVRRSDCITFKKKNKIDVSVLICYKIIQIMIIIIWVRLLDNKSAPIISFDFFSLKFDQCQRLLPAVANVSSFH